MGKLVVSLDGVVIKEVQITKDRTSLGRRPYNDIVIDNLAVSGEHAVLLLVGSDVFVEDLNSTNGTYLNGKAVRKQLLENNDTVEIGKYKIKYLSEQGDEFEKTMIVRPGAMAATRAGASGFAPSQPVPMNGLRAASPLAAPHTQPAPLTDHGQFRASSPAGLGTTTTPPSGFGHTLPPQQPASIKVLNGAAAGREVPLTKVVTTVGKPGVQVASITKRPGGYVFAHVEGSVRPAVNGQALTGEPVHLHNGDVIELAGTQMQFLQA